MKNGRTKSVRCAIYTRVSTDHGLEQDFNSLDAQYDASQAYIRSQAHAGWTLLRARPSAGETCVSITATVASWVTGNTRGPYTA